MQFLQSPFAGPIPDNDMLLHWRAPVGATIDDSTPPAAQLGRVRSLSLVAGSAYTTAPSVVAPDGSAWHFAGGAYATSSAAAGGVLDDYTVMSNAAANVLDGYAVQLVYDFSTTPTRAVVLEHSSDTSTAAGATLAKNCTFRLTWDPSSSMFELGWSDGASRRTLALGEVPSRGVFGLDITNRNSVVHAHYNGMLTSVATTTLGNGLNTNAGSSSSARWILGGSVHSGSAYNTPGMLLDGVVERVTVWRRPLTDAGHMAKYAEIVQPWDDTALLESGAVKCVVKVEVADTSVPPNWTNLSNFHGMDVVDSVDINESVDDVIAKAKVSVFRRTGQYDDLSPLNLEQEVVGVLGLRRRIRISRATVPQHWAVQGWEFKTRFDGYVDAWSMTEDRIDISCSDGLAPLQDAFIQDSRGFDYAAGVLSMEVVHQNLIDDFEPALDRRSTIIGYRGYLPATPPKNYTECGTAYTAWFQPSGFQIQFHDVSSGSVLSAMSSLTDQIGYGVRWKQHPPWAGFRLTSFGPKRDRAISHKQTETLSLTRVLVTCNEPHGLQLGSVATLSGKTDHNGGVSVSSILDYYRFVGDTAGSFLSSPTTETAGTVTFKSHVSLREEDLLEIGPVSTDVDRIRNSCVVKINRREAEITRQVVSISVDASKIMTLNFASDGDEYALFDYNVDPDNLGVTFELSVLTGESGNAALLAGSYTGIVTGPRQITSTVPTDPALAGLGYPGSGIASSTGYVYGTVHHEPYVQVVSTATASVAAYGLLPMGIYEGSNLAIDTVSEAKHLSDSVISDTAFPTYDTVFTSRVLPIGLHDVVSLPRLTHGRWTTVVDLAITALRERYRNGDCVAEYTGRFERPSLGLSWVKNIMDKPERPAFSGVNTSRVDLTGIQFRSDLGGQIRFQRNFDRDVNSLRHDRTEVWLSPTPQFVPKRDDRAVLVRGEHANITHDSSGVPLTPGLTYYGRVAERDIFGNLSNITGIDAAAGAITDDFSTTVRFMNRTANALVSTVSVATAFAALTTTWTSATMFQLDNGSDSGGKTFDTFGNYSSSSSRFVAPANGVVTLTCGIPVLGTLKTNNIIQGRLAKYTGAGVLVGTTTVRASDTIAAINGVGYLAFTESLTCSSGDQFQLQVRTSTGTGGAVMHVSSTTPTFGHVQYSLSVQN